MIVPNPGVVLIMLYFFISLLLFAIGSADHKSVTVQASMTRALLSLTAQVGIALYVIVSVRTSRARENVLTVLTAAITWACVVALLQNFRITDLRFALVPPGFVQNTDDIEIASRGGALRAVGTSAHAIEFSVLSAVGILLSFHLARFAATSLRRQLAAIAAVIAFVAMPTAVSRSGVVVLGAAFAVYMLAINVRTLGNVAIFAALGLLAQKVISPGSINALWSTIINSKEDDSIAARTDDYAAVSNVFHDHPWFGLGLGGYPPSEYRVLDNQWLQQVVAGGVTGVAALALLLISGVAGMIWRLRNAANPTDRDYAFVVGASFIGIIASAFTFDLFSFQQATFLLFTLYGLLWSERVPATAGSVNLRRQNTSPRSANTIRRTTM